MTFALQSPRVSLSEVKEESQLIRAAEAYLAAGMAELRKESPDKHAEVSEKLSAGGAKLTLVIAQDPAGWRSSAMMQEKTAASGTFESVQLFSFKQPIEDEAVSPRPEAVAPKPTPEKQIPADLSLDEFFDELERVREQFVWRLQADIHPIERRSSPRFWICGSPRDEEGIQLDPVEVVCHAITGARENWKKAAERIGLSKTDAASLNAAAVDRTWKGPDGNRKPDPYLIGLRARLLEAIGIRTKSSSESFNAGFELVSSGRTERARHSVGHDERARSSRDRLRDGNRRTRNRLRMKDPRK